MYKSFCVIDNLLHTNCYMDDTILIVFLDPQRGLAKLKFFLFLLEIKSFYCLSYILYTSIYLQLIWTSQIASQNPHKPAMMKNVNLACSLGFHTNKVTIRATCKDRAKHTTGDLPVIFIIPPMKIDAIPLHTPKQIMTKPMLLIPHPHETNAWKIKCLKPIKIILSTITFFRDYTLNKAICGNFCHHLPKAN